MQKKVSFSLVLVIVLLLVFAGAGFTQIVRKPIVLQFTPEEDQSDRYMMRLSLSGAVVEPWTPTDTLFIPEFGVNFIWEDSLTSVSEGVNRHKITIYTYDVIAGNFIGGGFGRGGGLGGGGGGSVGSGSPVGGLPTFSDFGSKTDSFSLPGSLGLAEIGGSGITGYVPLPAQSGLGQIGPMQDDGKAGDPETNFDFSRIVTSEIRYVTLKTGQVIDVRGLESIGKFSDAQVSEEEIVVDIENLFEWSHMLVLPPYPVYIEDFWYAELPLHVPGLPEPIPVKLYYQVMDYRRVMLRRIAVIDVSGHVEFDQYWERRDEVDDSWEKKYRAFGDMGITARFMFDLDRKEIFAIAKPPMDLPRYFGRAGFSPRLPGDAYSNPFRGLLNAAWGMPHPGLSVTTRMRYFTRFDDRRRLRTSAANEPEYSRKFYDMTFFAQEEAE